MQHVLHQVRGCARMIEGTRRCNSIHKQQSKIGDGQQGDPYAAGGAGKDGAKADEEAGVCTKEAVSNGTPSLVLRHLNSRACFRSVGQTAAKLPFVILSAAKNQLPVFDTRHYALLCLITNRRTTQAILHCVQNDKV